MRRAIPMKPWGALCVAELHLIPAPSIRCMRVLNREMVGIRNSGERRNTISSSNFRRRAGYWW
jgi:hypothetical protein